MQNSEIINVAVLLTCYNRKEKTIKALNAIASAFEYTNKTQKINYRIYLTNDGCTDGTREAVRSLFSEVMLKIIDSDGNSYWAGGMRLAWNEALKAGIYDYYLLVNDDTIMLKKSVSSLLSTDAYSLRTYKKRGIYTAFISSSYDRNLITYGAKVYKNSIFKGAVDIYPTGIPQLCNMPNANILFVSKEVVNQIGILDPIFTHGAADWDYGMRARNAGIPVLTTPAVCGICDNDHDVGAIEKTKVIDMNKDERKSFILRPTYYYSDALKFYYKYSRLKYYASMIVYYLFVYTPRLYYMIFEQRGH